MAADTRVPAGGRPSSPLGNVTPFGIASAEQFRSLPPTLLSSRRYARDFDEVKDVGAALSVSRSPHFSDVARFYAAVPAVGTWNPAVAQVTLARQRRLSFNARLFALVNMAISDALVTVMDTKYDTPSGDRRPPSGRPISTVTHGQMPTLPGRRSSLRHAPRAMVQRMLRRATRRGEWRRRYWATTRSR